MPDRRDRDPSRRLLWRRRLQIDRRRPDLAHVGLRESNTSAASASIPPIPTWSMSPRSATSSGPNRTAASSARSDGGKSWEKVLYRGRCRRNRPVDGSQQPAHPVRRFLADPPQFLEHFQRWSRQRPVPLDRRRRHLGGNSRAPGLPEARSARSASRSRRRKPGRVCALVETVGEKTGLYRRDDSARVGPWSRRTAT